jgi:hypothetical protein
VHVCTKKNSTKSPKSQSINPVSTVWPIFFRFIFHPVGNGEECEERLDDGDLLVMGGTMQQVRENGERGRERKTDRERDC